MLGKHGAIHTISFKKENKQKNPMYLSFPRMVAHAFSSSAYEAEAGSSRQAWCT